MGQIDGVDRRTDTVFLLLKYAGATESVRLQLLVFLLERETEYTEVYGDAVGFEYTPSAAGPFSNHLCREVDLLSEMDAVTPASSSGQSPTAADGGVDLTADQLRLTEKGQKIAKQLASSLNTRQATDLRGLVRTYCDQPLDDLLQYVQREYGTYVSGTHGEITTEDRSEETGDE